MTPEVNLPGGNSRTNLVKITGLILNLYKSKAGLVGETSAGPLNRLDYDGMFTGEVHHLLDGAYDSRGNFAVVSDTPHPFNIRSITLKVDFFNGENER